MHASAPGCRLQGGAWAGAGVPVPTDSSISATLQCLSFVKSLGLTTPGRVYRGAAEVDPDSTHPKKESRAADAMVRHPQ